MDSSHDSSMSVWKSTVLEVIETILPRASDLGLSELEQYCLDSLEHDRDQKCVMLLKRHETYKLLSKSSTKNSVSINSGTDSIGRIQSMGDLAPGDRKLDNHSIRFGRLCMGSEGGMRAIIDDGSVATMTIEGKGEGGGGDIGSPVAGISVKDSLPAKPKKRLSTMITERISGVFRGSSGESDEVRPYDYESVVNEGTLQAPIMDICIVMKTDPPPPGFYRIAQTSTFKRANLNTGSGGVPLYLCIKKVVPTTVKRPPHSDSGGHASDGNADGMDAAMPVVAVQIIFPDRGEFLPMGFTVARVGSARSPANLNHGASGAERVYLCYKRDFTGNPIVDIQPILPLSSGAEEAACPSNFQLVDRTLGGMTANINSSTGGARVFLSYFQRLRQLQPLRAGGNSGSGGGRSGTGRSNRQRGESGDSVSSNSSFGSHDNTAHSMSSTRRGAGSDVSASAGRRPISLYDDEDENEDEEEDELTEGIPPTSCTVVGERVKEGGNLSASDDASDDDDNSDESNTDSDDDDDDADDDDDDDEDEGMVMLSQAYLRASHRLSLDLKRGDGYALSRGLGPASIGGGGGSSGGGSNKRKMHVVDSYGIPRDSSSCRSLLLLLTALYTRTRAISQTAIYGLLALLKSSTFFEADFIEAPEPGSLTLTHMAVEAVCDRLDLGDEKESKYLLLFLYLFAKRAKGHVPAATVSRIFKSLYHTIGNQSTNDEWIARGMAPHPCRTFDYDPYLSSAETHAGGGNAFGAVDTDFSADGAGAGTSGTSQATVADRLESLGSTIAPEGLTVLSVFTAMLTSFALPVERLSETGDANLDRLLRFLPREEDIFDGLGKERESSIDASPVPVRAPSAGSLSNSNHGNDNKSLTSGAGSGIRSESGGKDYAGRIVTEPETALMRELVLDLIDEVTNNVEVASIVDTAKKVVSRGGLSASGSSFWSQVNILSKMLFIQPQLQGTFMIMMGACKMCWGGLRYEGYSKAGALSHRTMRRASSAGRSPNVRDYGCKLTGLVLLGDILSRSREVIRGSAILGYVVRRVVVPCLLHNVPAALQDHRLFSKVLAVITALWRSWRVHLRVEIAFMVEHLFIAVMQGDGRPVFQMIVIQEVVKWFDQPQLLVEMFVNYDIADSHHLGHWNLFNHLVRSISATAKKINSGEGEDSGGGGGGGDSGEAGKGKGKVGSGGGTGASNRRRTSSAHSDDGTGGGVDQDGEDGTGDGAGARKGKELADLCSYFSSQDQAYVGSITARNVHIQSLEEVCRIAKTLMDASGHAFLIIQDKEFRERSLGAGAGWEDDGSEGEGEADGYQSEGDTEEVAPQSMTIAQAAAYAVANPSTGTASKAAVTFATVDADTPSTPDAGTGAETAGIGARRDSTFSSTVKRSRVTSVAMRRASHREKGNTLDEAVSLYQTKKHSIAKAIRYLISKAFISDTPQEIASFLRIYKQRFDPTAIGEYLGQDGPQYEQIMFRYIRATSFAELTVEPALRLFLTGCGFRLPGEGQKVSRFVDCFEKVYWADNSGTPQCPFRASNTIFLVAYAIIMLNSDHHRANIGKRAKAKMSKEAFIKNLAGTDVDGDIDNGYLGAIFDSVEASAIEMDFSTSEGTAEGPRASMRPEREGGESLFGAFGGGGRTKKIRRAGSKGSGTGQRFPSGLNPLLHTSEGAGTHSMDYYESAVESSERFQRETCRELKECEDVLRAMRSFAFRFQLTGRETNISLDLVSFMYETVWFHFRAITQALLQRPSSDMFITFHALDLLSYVLTSSIFLGLQQEKQQLARQLLDFQTEYCVKKHSPSSGGDDAGEWSTPRSKPGLSQSWYKDVCDLAAADPRTLEVISKLHKLIVHLKDECQEISSHELTTSVASRIEGTRNILARNAYFVREGSLFKVSHRNGNQRQYRFFLFSDELIYGSVGLLGGQYRTHGQLPLHSMTVTDMDSDPTHCSMFIDHPYKSFTVMCPSPLAKNQWLRDIFQAISNCNLRAAMEAEAREEEEKRLDEEGEREEQGRYSYTRTSSSHPHRGSGTWAGDATIEHQAAFLRSVTLSPQRDDHRQVSAVAVNMSSSPRGGGAKLAHDAINMTNTVGAGVGVADDSSTLSGMTMDSDDSEDVEDLAAAQAAILRGSMTPASKDPAVESGLRGTYVGQGLSPAQERAIQEAGEQGDWCQLSSDSEDEDL